MAARKKEAVALQKEILTDEAFEIQVLGHNGVCVVDVYQQWCGPCKAPCAMFRRIKNELADDLLSFAVCEADSVDNLSFYRGKCIPTFLFYAGGKLQTVVRGCDAPKLEKTIQECLVYEHKVQDGIAQRKESADPELEKILEERRQADIEAKKPKPKAKVCSVMIIKPDAVANGQAEEILESIKESGIEVLTYEERMLCDDEARHLYLANESEHWFDELIEFMTSGPCWVVVVTKGATGETIVPDLRTIIGPIDSQVAKEAAPETLRAKYGTEKIRNAVHAADTSDAAAMELAFFFPDFDAPLQELPEEPKPLQRTLALIRPDAYREHGEQIIIKIKEAGFQIAMSKDIRLTKEQAMEFYKEHQGEHYFDTLVQRMINGPVLALGLAREDAISKWRSLLGPKEKAREVAPESLRGQFYLSDCSINCLHGSATEEDATHELEYFFPVEKTLLAIKPNALSKKDEIVGKIKESGFHIAAQKETQLTKDVAQQIYSEHAGKDFFDSLTDFMSSGETLFLVLQKQNAVNDLIRLSGHKDPMRARQTDPEALRALFGEDILRNAVHRASSMEEAKENIAKLFDDSEIVEDDKPVEDHNVDAEGALEGEVSASEPQETNGKSEQVEAADPQSQAADAEEEPHEHSTAPALPSGPSQSSTDIPESSADVPESSADVPESSADVPESSADVPESSADLPESSADVPESSADVPESSADVPELSADVPESAVNYSVSADAEKPPDPSGDNIPSDTGVNEQSECQVSEDTCEAQPSEEAPSNVEVTSGSMAEGNIPGSSAAEDFSDPTSGKGPEVTLTDSTVAEEKPTTMERPGDVATSNSAEVVTSSETPAEKNEKAVNPEGEQTMIAETENKTSEK